MPLLPLLCTLRHSLRLPRASMLPLPRQRRQNLGRRRRERGQKSQQPAATGMHQLHLMAQAVRTMMAMLASALTSLAMALPWKRQRL